MQEKHHSEVFVLCVFVNTELDAIQIAYRAVSFFPSIFLSFPPYNFPLSTIFITIGASVIVSFFSSKISCKWSLKVGEGGKDREMNEGGRREAEGEREGGKERERGREGRKGRKGLINERKD